MATSSILVVKIKEIKLMMNALAVQFISFLLHGESFGQFEVVLKLNKFSQTFQIATSGKNSVVIIFG